MNTAKRYLTGAVMFFMAAIVSFLTAGCEMSGLGVENYMRPPAPAGDSAEVQALLLAELGEYTLRYPRSGSYRSAVVLRNIDEDKAEEVIAFYRLSTENTGSHMIVLDCDSRDSWSVAGANIGSGEIDRILFGDINGDGTDEIITGWSGISDGRVMNVHSLDGGVLHSVNIVSGEDDSYPAAQYYEMAVGDFDGDRRDEIMTVFRNPLEGTAVARILRLSYGIDGSAQMRTAGSIPTDGSVYQYINAQAGYTSMGDFCMVVDGCRADGRYVTEIIRWDAETDMLAVPLNRLGEPICSLFERTLPTVSQDINGDGIIEIPADKLLPGYSQRSEEPMYLTLWYRLQKDEAQLAMKSVVRFDHGYLFRFPVGWDGRVTVQPDPNEAIMYFYLVGSDAPFTNELFRIKIFTLDEWDDRRETLADTLLSSDDAPNYEMLAQTDYYVYAALIAPQADGGFAVTAETVKEYFQLTD